MRYYCFGINFIFVTVFSFLKMVHRHHDLPAKRWLKHSWNPRSRHIGDESSGDVKVFETPHRDVGQPHLKKSIPLVFTMPFLKQKGHILKRFNTHLYDAGTSCVSSEDVNELACDEPATSNSAAVSSLVWAPTSPRLVHPRPRLHLQFLMSQ